MKFSREGINFKFHEFSITYRWPILQTYFFQTRFFIKELSFESDSIFECFAEILRPNKPLKDNGDFLPHKKVQGFNFEDMLIQYGRLYFSSSIGLVIFDIDVSSKPNSFWKVIPNENKKEFLKDAIFLTCSSKKEMERISDSIPNNFGTIIKFLNGNVINENRTD